MPRSRGFSYTSRVTEYRRSLEGIRTSQLEGFFKGWPNPPTPETHLEILRRASHVVLAVDGSSDRVIGFVTAISDGLLSAYVPLLEVRPEFQHRGIGSELMRRMLEALGGMYMIDLLCDPELRAFYAKLGMRESSGMLVRNFARQSGA
jgi:ribosomal protein S18 acetylase RimI-like enzyme